VQWEIYLDGNNLEGELPRYLTGSFVDAGTMGFHSKKLSGKLLDVLLWSLPNLNLWTLNLGSNSLIGEIDQSMCGLTGVVVPFLEHVCESTDGLLGSILADGHTHSIWGCGAHDGLL